MDPERFVSETVEALRKKLDAPAILGASGGVDSTVVAALAHSAIGDRLTPIFVDTGYMRKGEGDAVRRLYEELGIELVFVDASERFYAALEGVIEPERKRRAIGHTFIDVFAEAAMRIDATYLLQGTIAPDWIESGGGIRDTIKSHHNVGGLPEVLHMTLVEPIRDLYKDEVREVARHLGIPVAKKQPYPGPGLAIRILGEATRDRTRIVREACYIVETEIAAAAGSGALEEPWQYFAVLLPIRSVGVHGDLRAYGYTIVVRAVYSLDGMTANYAQIPHQVLDRISRRIANEMGEDVTRVVYDITNKPPGTIEWE
ncbi:MAG: glutamine-hydrolyzing GMP synthase [Thermoplasmata archaeon]|nr:glutamine-hydrolyzing GMP synthase [Thermoplasmata archaeon]